MMSIMEFIKAIDKDGIGCVKSYAEALQELAKQREDIDNTNARLQGRDKRVAELMEEVRVLKAERGKA